MERYAFISLPMGTRSPEDVEKEFNRIKDLLMDAGFSVLDTLFYDLKPEGWNEGVWYLAKSIEKLADADVAFFAKGWQDARGCVAEHFIALSYGIPVVYEEE